LALVIEQCNQVPSSSIARTHAGLPSGNHAALSEEVGTLTSAL